MLLGQDSLGEGFLGVVGEDGDDSLDDDGAFVAAFAHEVDGAAGEPHAVFEGLFLAVEAGEGRATTRGGCS